MYLNIIKRTKIKKIESEILIHSCLQVNIKYKIFNIYYPRRQFQSEISQQIWNFNCRKYRDDIKMHSVKSFGKGKHSENITLLIIKSETCQS